MSQSTGFVASASLSSPTFGFSMWERYAQLLALAIASTNNQIWVFVVGLSNRHSHIESRLFCCSSRSCCAISLKFFDLVLSDVLFLVQFLRLFQVNSVLRTQV
eukprot:c12686_g1_i1.p1 GENE.c12686_g1_i1~~c12686_g1_i1.p1  ORF type:complete len:103 (+),score=14.87 c12686_g1_i1:365-673(+)